KAVSQTYYDDYVVSPDSDATRWGIGHEAQAIREFANKSNFVHQEIGLEFHPTIKDIAATPDARIIEDENSNEFIFAEIKCPFKQAIHQNYCSKIFDTTTLKKSSSEYF